MPGGAWEICQDSNGDKKIKYEYPWDLSYAEITMMKTKSGHGGSWSIPAGVGVVSHGSECEKQAQD